ncbi:MAG: antitoxin VbhA family protein [Oscillospiraceae bacterium]|nr:antitoxin VbhA family protein [Oscillospiraceae bacterium]
MTPERAVDNAIASTKMEGFKISDEQRSLMLKVVRGEITFDEALKMINSDE